MLGPTHCLYFNKMFKFGVCHVDQCTNFDIQIMRMYLVRCWITQIGLKKYSFVWKKNQNNTETTFHYLQTRGCAEYYFIMVKFFLSYFIMVKYDVFEWCNYVVLIYLWRTWFNILLCYVVLGYMLIYYVFVFSIMCCCVYSSIFLVVNWASNITHIEFQ